MDNNAVAIQDLPTPRAVVKSRVGRMTHLLPGASPVSEEQQQLLFESLEECLHNQESQVIIDMSKVTQLNSQNIELLLMFHR